MVVVPTSKLRLADASCSAVAVFSARTTSSVSCAASTSKYAWTSRTIRSWPAAVSWASAISTERLACSQAATLPGRYSGCVAFTPRVWPVKVRCTDGLTSSEPKRVTLLDRLADGRMPPRACSARNRFASYWAFADCQVPS